MQDTYKFPNGYDVTVVRKQDIIDCLDENVVDKDLVLAVITQCEVDAANFIQNGRWTGIPFIGNIRVPKRIQKIQSPEVQELIQEARETLDKDRYVIFRKQLYVDIDKEERRERFCRYMVSQFASRHEKYYKRLVREHGEAYAQFKCWTLCNLSEVYPKEFYSIWQQD